MKYTITVLLTTLALAGCSSSASRYELGGAAGAAGGAGGAGSQAGAGAAGAGAAGMGAAAGAGGAQATCSAEEAFSTAAMPTSWIWDSFSWERDGKCISCAAAPCAEFQVSYDDLLNPPAWEEPTLVRVLLDSSDTLWLDANAGVCGAETQCRYGISSYPHIWLRMTPVAGGWEANVEQVSSGVSTFSNTAACNDVAPLQWYEAIRNTLIPIVEDNFSGLFFPCPS